MDIEKFMEKAKEKEKKLFRSKRKFFIFSAAIFGVIILTFLAVYLISPLNKTLKPVAKIVPFPAAMINGKDIISSRELIKNTKAIEKFYQSQDFSSAGLRVDFSTKEGKQRLKIKEKDIFDKLVEDELIKKLANQRGIKIETVDAQRDIESKIEEAGDRNTFLLNLKNVYGWGIDDFRDNIVIPQLYARKLAEYYLKNEAEKTPAYSKMQQALAELAEDNSNFSEVAKKYSEGDSAQSGGDLGWFKKDQLVGEVAQVAFEMEAGKRSEIIKSSLGYHIILVEKTRKVSSQPESDIEPEMEVQLKQIFVRDGGFIDWLIEEKKKAKIWVLTKEYQWDRESAQIKFSDSQMEVVENQLKVKADGDPSLSL